MESFQGYDPSDYKLKRQDIRPIIDVLFFTFKRLSLLRTTELKNALALKLSLGHASPT